MAVGPGEGDQMKRGPIPKKLQTVILHPNIRIGMLDDLKLMEEKVLKIKKILQAQTDELLMVYEDIQTLHSMVRELGGERVHDE